MLHTHNDIGKFRFLAFWGEDFCFFDQFKLVTQEPVPKTYLFSLIRDKKAAMD